MPTAALAGASADALAGGRNHTRHNVRRNLRSRATALTACRGRRTARRSSSPLAALANLLVAELARASDAACRPSRRYARPSLHHHARRPPHLLARRRARLSLGRRARQPPRCRARSGLRRRLRIGSRISDAAKAGSIEAMVCSRGDEAPFSS